MQTVEGVYRSIEDILAENISKATERLLNTNKTYEHAGEMQQDLGRVQGLQAALRLLRTSLGYNHNSL